MVNTCSMSRTQQEILSTLSNPQRKSSHVVNTFQSFSARRTSQSALPGDPTSAHISLIPTLSPPGTPTQPRAGSVPSGNPDDGDPHQENVSLLFLALFTNSATMYTNQI